MPKNKTVLKAGEVLIMRTCDKDMRGHGGFQWPKSGKITCPDWDPKPACGNGLHGLLWGEGDSELLNWDESSKWMLTSFWVSPHGHTNMETNNLRIKSRNWQCPILYA